MKIQQAAWRGDTLLAEGEIRIGCVDDVHFRPRRMPIEVTHKIP
jgi:acyl-CoA thioester hydrolase